MSNEIKDLVVEFDSTTITSTTPSSFVRYNAPVSGYYVYDATFGFSFKKGSKEWYIYELGYTEEEYNRHYWILQYL